MIDSQSYISEDSTTNDLFRPLKSRFYILITFSLFNFLSGFLWNAWSPIKDSIHEIYYWSNSELDLQANLFAIIFCVFVVPFTFAWNKTGIQFMYYASAAVFLVGTFIRLYPGSIVTQSNLIQVGSAITGFGSLMALIAPPVISMIWFPSHERSRATSTPLAFNFLGTALSPIISSQMVPDISRKNETMVIENGIKSYLFLHCCMAIIVLAMILIYFPSKPPIPPCKSSDETLRLDFWVGCKILIKNKQFWIVFFVNMIVYGFNNGLSAVSSTYTLPMGITQKQFGTLNSITNIFTFLSCLLGGWLGDRFSYKSIVYASIPPTFISYIFTGLLCMNVIHPTLLILYILNIVQNFTTSFASPVTFEMGVETAFPVSEEVSTAVLAFATNFGMMLFLSLCMIPMFGTTWIPFFYSFVSLLLIPLMIFYKDERKRTKYDHKYANGDVVQVDINNSIQRFREDSPLLGA